MTITLTKTHTETETLFEPAGRLQIVILHVLWNLMHKPELCTVAKVAADVNEKRVERGERPLAYTTFLTVMRNLARRKLVSQQQGTASRGHIFVPTQTRDGYEQQVLRYVYDTVFQGYEPSFRAAIARVFP